MNKDYHTYLLEELLFDNEFLRIAKEHYKGEDESSWPQLLEQFPEKRELMEKAYVLINGLKIEETGIAEFVIQEDWIKLQKKIRNSHTKKVFYWLTSAAACFILIVSGLYFSQNDHPGTYEIEDLMSLLTEMDTDSNEIQLIVGDEGETTVNENARIIEKEDGTVMIIDENQTEIQNLSSDYMRIIVPKGKRSYVEMKDGSKIWINSGTKLLYPSRFDDKKREIYVDGEVYLEVSPDNSVPFLVHTVDLVVKVLGTSFNVTAYHEDNFADVVLVTGKVEVSSNNESTQLHPNTSYHWRDNKGIVQKVDVYKYICWKEGIMQLDGMPLGEVFKKLSRYYNVSIEAAASVEEIRYLGKLSLEDSIETILYNISMVEPIEVRKENNVIHIRLADKF